jgi:hypothetical protein
MHGSRLIISKESDIDEIATETLENDCQTTRSTRHHVFMEIVSISGTELFGERCIKLLSISGFVYSA